MRILGVIPARYSSSRLPGKPLADICGKPMIWWVYNQAIKVPDREVIVATDDQRIVDACKTMDIPCMLTGQHGTHVERIFEVSTKIDADYYISINGDEPLIDPDTIVKVFPKEAAEECYVGGLMRPMDEPTEVIDPGNIKVVVDSEGFCLFLSRSPIPFPYKTILYKYYKLVGVECYNKFALKFMHDTPPSTIEKIEDVTLLRFIEHHLPVKYTLVDSFSLSVDTQRDLEKVRSIISERQSVKQ